MKKNTLWIAATLCVLPSISFAEESPLENPNILNGKEIQIQAKCNNWSLNCLLDKIVSSGTTSLLGPGVSGDP